MTIFDSLLQTSIWKESARMWKIALSFAVLCVLGTAGQTAAQSTEITKVKDIVIYTNADFYSAFPSVVTRPDGELIVAFRRAPYRQIFGEKGTSHVDPNSYLVLVRSKDNAASWTSEPELIFAHPFGGSQDPCMIQLQDGSIVCSSYGWARVNDDVAETFDATIRHGNFVFMGGYLLHSKDGGDSWQGPIIPPTVPGTAISNVFGDPCPAYNRGAMTQGANGRLYWACAVIAQLNPRRTEVHLLTSDDRGYTWSYACPIATDEKASFNETSLYETPQGDLVAFLRTANFNDATVVARSTDGGKSFHPWQDSGFQGHPHFALRLPDNRVLLIYGYRHEPYGIRGRILDAECRNFETAEEIILRDDGGNGDIGYPWATMMADGRVLVTYYFNKSNGLRHIAGTVLAIE